MCDLHPNTKPVEVCAKCLKEESAANERLRAGVLDLIKHIPNADLEEWIVANKEYVMDVIEMSDSA